MSLNKYFTPSNYYLRLFSILGCTNRIVDSHLKPVPFEDLKTLSNVEIAHLEIASSEYESWVKQYFPTWEERFGHLRYKKLVEFFATFTLLEPQPDDVFMDAAGGVDTYLNRLDCRTKYLQDNRMPRDLTARLGSEITYIKGDAGGIQLPDSSVDKISCHHALEHFQEGSDSSFIREVQRLLRPGGKCCIIPVFIANQYGEVTNTFTFDKKFDSRSKLIVDPTAVIPGGIRSGNYARIYDLLAFEARVLQHIDFTAFGVTITELRMDGDTVPDPSLKCHKNVAAIDHRYRALTIERLN